MTILNNDIKIYQAQDNTDNDSGGGSRTSVEIVDGDVNNLFPDISRIDTVSGDVSLRKVFPTVVTTNRDLYYGAHAMIRKNPTDANVSALLFHTDSPHDKRIEAQDKIESYVIASYEEEFYLYGNHVAGAKSVTWLQLITSTPPSVGEIYMLRDADNVTEQFVRVSSVDSQNINLVHTTGSNNPITYTRRRIICEIEQPLDVAFVGSDFAPSGQQANTATTFATQIADAAKFYGTKTLDVNATNGDQVITVDSIYEQVVPASVTQTPIVNADAVVDGLAILPTGKTVSITLTGATLNAGDTVSLPHAVVPNSMTQVLNSNYGDDGIGNIIQISSGNIYGTIDYKTGIMVFTDNLGTGGTAEYEIANAMEAATEFTNGTLITQGNQNLVYVQNLSPRPSQTDLYIDYRSNGKWYRITSNADGTLGQDANIGAGTVSDNGDGTGTVSLTLGAIPDIDSTIIYSWGSADRFTHHVEERTINSQTTTIPEISTRYIKIDLADGDIDPLTFVMQLYDVTDSALVNITADIEGNLIDASATRAISGELDFVNGTVYIEDVSSSSRFPNLQAVGQNIIIDYDTLTTAVSDPHEIKANIASKTPTGGEVTASEDTGTGTITFNLGEAITDRASVIISMPIVTSEFNDWGGVTPSYRGIEYELLLRSDAAGNLHHVGATIYGVITGTVALNGDVSITLIKNTHRENNPAYAGSFGSEPKYLTITDSYYTIADMDFSFQYRVDAPLGGVTRTAATQVDDTAENLLKYVINAVGGITGEVAFNFLVQTTTSETYLFYSEGSNIYHDYDAATGVGIQVGSIVKNTGVITLDYMFKPSTMYLDFQALFTDEVEIVEYDTGTYTAPFRNVVFKTAATKLSTGSFQLRYESENGSQSATTDANGVITGTDIDSGTSYVDSITGMASIDFTADVLAQSLRYDAVAESSLPLDPDLLGLDPVRLPIDGRVPVFTAGGHIVIFNEVTTATTNATPLADDVETLARSGQAYIEVIDVNGKRLDPTQYVADKVAGTVTFNNPLTLEDKYAVALTGPFSVVDRIEDMLLATEVQINGLISLSAPLAHDYTAGITKVASSLVWGDTGARVYNYFSQEIWDSGNPAWSDVLIGDPTTSQYDEINYPIQTDNQSSTSGRWAIIFKSTTTVDVVEEKLGVVEAGVSISVDDVAPINPATGNPYFTMDKDGFGAGWVTNNVIRINTDSGDNNMWVIRTVKSGALTESIDDIVLEIRGDAN